MSLDTLSLTSLPQTLQVMVKKPEGIIFNGKAVAVTSVNEDGPFAIIPLHTNFISIIQESLIIHISATEKREIPIQGGILKVFGNAVAVYLGIFPQ